MANVYSSQHKTQLATQYKVAVYQKAAFIGSGIIDRFVSPGELREEEKRYVLKTTVTAN